MMVHAVPALGEPMAHRRTYPDGMSTLEAVATVATGMSFLVLTTFVLANTTDLMQVGVVVFAQTLAYVATSPVGSVIAERWGAWRAAQAADLLSAVAVGGVAATGNRFAGLIGVAAALGALRAVRDRAHQVGSGRTQIIADDDTSAPAREGLLRFGLALVGAVAGAAVAWLGVGGALWLLAMIFIGSAAWGLPRSRRAASPTTGSMSRPETPAETGGQSSTGQTVPSGETATSAMATPTMLVPAGEAAPPVETLQPEATASATTTAAPWPTPAAAPSPSSASASMRGAVAELYRDSLVRRLVVSLFLTHLLVMSAAAVLVTLWVRQALPAIENLGFVAGAFVLGAVGGGLVLGGRSHYPIRLVAVGIGYLAGAGAVAISGGVAPIRLLILIAAMVIGAGTASVTPVLGEVISQRVPASLRSRVGGLVATTAFAGLPLGAVGAAWLVGHTSLIRGVLVAAGCYLIAMLLPLVTYATWRDLGLMAPAAPGLMVSSPKLAARVTVTLAYANGQWIVEVRRGRALLGTRHLVKSAEAMDVLARLDMPAVQRSIESALAADQVEATSQAERMRGQLADVETRLADIAEMLEITDQRKAPVPATGARPVPDPETP